MARILIVTFALISIGGVVSAEPDQRIVLPYLQIQIALANDSTEGVSEAAASVVSAAASLGESGKMIAIAAKALVDASTLEATREKFGPMSEALIAYGNEVGFGELKVAYCPMVSKSWVQKASAIRNPFYGSTMLTCGHFTN